MARLIAIATAFILVVTLGTTAAAAAPRSDLERTVFVHYRSAPSVPDAALQARTSTCPDPTTCTDNRWRGNYWPNGTVSYELNAPSGLSSAGTAVAAAFGAWQTAVNSGGGHLSISGSNGNTSCDSAGTTTNGVNQVCWRDLTSSYPNAIAVTFIWAYRSNKQIAEADTIFNSGPGFSWSYTNPGTCGAYDSCNNNTGASGTYDIRDIGTHEFGHFLALFSDLYNSRDAELTMYGYGSTGETKKDSLAKGDCLGITAAYGGTCP
jgi:hypothetical protein